MTKEFESTLTAREIILRQDGAESDSIETNAGQWFPIIRIKDTVFERADITSFDYIVGRNLLPVVSIMIDNYAGHFSDNQFPEADDLITIRLSNSFDTVHQPIKLDLMMIDAIGFGNNMSFSAVNYVPALHAHNNKAFDGTITDVLRAIAKECGLGYVSNFNSSNDTGTWICKENYYEFIGYLQERLFISEDDCVSIFIDQYNNLNVVSLKSAKLDRTEYELLTDPATGKQFDKSYPVYLTNQEYNDSESKKLVVQRWHPNTNYGSQFLTSNETASFQTKTSDKHIDSTSEQYDSVSSNALNGTRSQYYSDRISNETSFKKVLTSKAQNARLRNILMQGTYIDADIKHYVPDVFVFMHTKVDIWEQTKTQNVLSQDASVTNDTLPTKLEGKGSTEAVKNNIFSGSYCVVDTTYSFIANKEAGNMKQSLTLLKLK